MEGGRRGERGVVDGTACLSWHFEVISRLGLSIFICLHRSLRTWGLGGGYGRQEGMGGRGTTYIISTIMHSLSNNLSDFS